MSKINSLCVYCGSSNKIPKVYQDAAKKLGKILAQKKIKMVYGGGVTGLMGICADSCVESGGYVIGITTGHLASYEGGHKKIPELYVVENMHQRKIKMFDLSDGFLCLPGGLGTLDEVFEIMTWKQIGLHKKNLVFVNIQNYWDPLLKGVMSTMLHNGFIRHNDQTLYNVAFSIEEAIEMVTVPQKKNHDFVAKWG